MVEYLKLSHSVSLRDLASSVSENLDAFWECVAPASDDRMLSLVMDLFMAKQLNVTLEYAARNRDEVNRAWLYRSAK
jgi:RNAse (barnase) inhibitor barstar